MISFIYNKLLQTKYRPLIRIMGIIIPYITKVVDPTVSIKIGQKTLRMPLSHRIPINISLYKYYDTLLPRLGNSILCKTGSFCLIDVGANIGDTAIMVVGSVSRSQLLCIEPDPEYFEWLEKNTNDIKSVTRLKVALGDGVNSSKSVVMDKAISGTAIIESGSGVSLDSVLSEHSPFTKANVLKIDTDGFDYKVLRGSAVLLREAKPTLIFEHSPEHCLKVAKEDPLAVFDFLARSGYNHFIFYDSQGYLLAGLSSTEVNAIQQLVHYAHITGRYYDILCFHDDQETFRREFMKSEYDFFPLYDRPYLKKCC